MENFNNFLVFPIDYKSKIAFLAPDDLEKSWTFDVDWSFPLLIQKSIGFIKSAKDDEEESENKKKDREMLPNGIQLIALSEVNNLISFTTNDKSLFICKIENNQCKTLSRRLFGRTASMLRFSRCGKMIFLADKTGDVFEFSCEELEAPGKFIFGHISLILDLKISHDAKYILTSDRDEKIRISNYPATHDIESFCLGHEEFVSSFDFIDHERIISVSGDKTMKLWRFVDGAQLFTSDIDFAPLQVKTISTSPTSGLIFVSSLSFSLYIFEYNSVNDDFKVEKKSEKQYPSDIEMAINSDSKCFIKYVQEGKVFIDQINVKEKLVIYKNLHEDVLSTLNCNDLQASTFKPFDITYLFKNAKIEGEELNEEFVEKKKRQRIEQMKEKYKQRNKKPRFNKKNDET